MKKDVPRIKIRFTKDLIELSAMGERTDGVRMPHKVYISRNQPHSEPILVKIVLVGFYQSALRYLNNTKRY